MIARPARPTERTQDVVTAGYGGFAEPSVNSARCALADAMRRRAGIAWALALAAGTAGLAGDDGAMARDPP